MCCFVLASLWGPVDWFSSLICSILVYPPSKMVGVTEFHKIFKGRKALPEEELRASLISGGVVALAEKLRIDHGWNGVSLLAAPFLTLEAGAGVDSYWAGWDLSLFDQTG